MNIKSTVDLQNELNIKTCGEGWVSGKTDKGRDIDWFRCTYMECSEAINSTQWKHWANLTKQESIVITKSRDTTPPCDFEYLSKTIFDVGKPYKLREWGLLRKLYNAMKARSKIRGHALMTFSFSEFVIWAYNNDYKKLYDFWVEEEYSKWLRPSVDRINDYLGYTFDNMQLTTWEINQQKQRDDVHNATSTSGKAICVQVEQLTLSGEHIAYFESTQKAADAVGLKNRASITQACSDKYINKTAKGFLWKYVEVEEVTETRTIPKEDDIDNIRMEIVDIWHFVLSILIQHKGIESTKKYLDSTLAVQIYGDKFTGLEKLMLLSLERNSNAIGLLEAFGIILGNWGMSVQELVDLYVTKNVLNIFRQDNGYKEGSYIKNWSISTESDDFVEDNEVIKRLATKAKTSDELYDLMNSHYNLVKIIHSSIIKVKT